MLQAGLMPVPASGPYGCFLPRCMSADLENPNAGTEAGAPGPAVIPHLESE